VFVLLVLVIAISPAKPALVLVIYLVATVF